MWLNPKSERMHRASNVRPQAYSATHPICQLHACKRLSNCQSRGKHLITLRARSSSVLIFGHELRTRTAHEPTKCHFAHSRMHQAFAGMSGKHIRGSRNAAPMTIGDSSPARGKSRDAPAIAGRHLPLRRTTGGWCFTAHWSDDASAPFPQAGTGSPMPSWRY